MRATSTAVASGESGLRFSIGSSQGSAGQRLGWEVDIGRCDYQRALDWQRSLIALRRRGVIRDMLIYVEHPPCVTLGRQSHPENLRGVDESIPLYEIERGGDVTYHGPGQLVCYPIFDLNRFGRDLHRFIRNLEQGVIATLADYGVSGKRIADYTGVWVDTPDGERKVASIGIAAQKWISFHGVAVNLTTDLSAFESINPCGLEAKVMTSVKELTGQAVSRLEFASKLTKVYAKLFETDFAPVDLAQIAEDLQSEEGGGHV